MNRKEVIRRAVDAYFEGLGKKDFDLIPFSDDVELRAPLAPGGVHNPIHGRDAVRAVWWEPLPGLLGTVRRGSVYFDDELTGAIAEAEIEVLVDPPVILRVADRFNVDEAGHITEQENHFDPRDVTNPGWRTP
jgi:hypothetical protein